MTKQIKLTKGKFAVIDDNDFALVSRYNWRASKSGNTYYATTDIWVPGEKRITIDMHRLILGDSSPATDHADGDGLNNTRLNIRACTYSENNMNKAKQSNNTSGFKGVSKNGSKRNPWASHIQANKANKFIGHFPTAEEAARAYDKAAKELFGEFARLNFPEGQTQ